MKKTKPNKFHSDIAIITATCHRFTLNRAINSCINQIYPYWHQYVIGDGFNPNTIQVVKNYNDKRISVHFTPKTQSQGNFQRQIALINIIQDEKYIIILDDDNEIHPLYLKVMRDAIINSKKTWAICQIQHNEMGVLSGNLKFGEIDALSFMISSFIAKQVIWKDIGRYAEDWFYIQAYSQHSLSGPPARVKSILGIHY